MMPPTPMFVLVLFLLVPSMALENFTPAPRRGQHRTPFGLRADGCSLEVPSGSRIDEAVRGGVGGVLVTRPRRAGDGSLVAGAWESAAAAFFYAAPGHCHADMGLVLSRRRQQRQVRAARPAPSFRPGSSWDRGMMRHPLMRSMQFSHLP
jgi:hypothetical protein